jgi:hypothetical protein
MKGKLNIPPGSVFGELTVIREAKKYTLPSGQTNRAMRCKCSCGKIKNIRLLHLVRGRIKSCGHLNGENHGLSSTKLYRVWSGMRDRATLDSFIHAHRYKKRGIKICNSWLNSFTYFKNWALKNGYKHDLTIDRINNNGDYRPGNCRFVTNKVNCNNKEATMFVVYNKKIVALSLILEERKMSAHYHTIYGRIKRGWDDQKAIDTKIRKGNYKSKTNPTPKAA